MIPQFHCVLGNRDYLKVDGEKRPIWEFVEGWDHWLTSLVYLKNVRRPPGGRFILDCGAWSYKAEATPRWSPVECVERYLTFAQPGDILASPDHMVLRNMSPEEEAYRVDLTLQNAREFLHLCPADYSPIGVTHGSTIESRIQMTRDLLEIGYRHVAIGSVAIRAGNRRFINGLLAETTRLRAESPFYLHVLGVSALSWYPEYVRHEVDSFDGSSMFFSAFTAGEFYEWVDGKIIGHCVKGSPDLTAIPPCDCLSCATMRSQGIDTRQMGSNENNMGRAVHNINVYLRGLRELQSSPVAVVPQMTLGL
jgi:tRNA-guanine family transglycosylase